MSVPSSPAIDAFVQAWRNAFVKVLTQLGAPNLVASAVDGAALKCVGEENPGVVSMKFQGGGCLKGFLQWSCEQPVVLQCAQLLMSEPLNAAVEFTPTHTDGFLEFLRQVAGEAAVTWKTEKGEPTEIVHQADSAPVPNAEHTVGIAFTSEQIKNLTFRLDMDAELCAAVSATPAEIVEEEAADEEISAPQKVPSNLELILDVQLEATIRFGEREMLLHDVFGLMPGAIVELNQLVTEPAELLVAGRLVAKGEVVVVDGNFGLRVTEVISRSQRAAVLSLE